MAKTIAAFLLGIVAAGACAAGCVYLLASHGRLPANADASPPFCEKWLARIALDAAIDRQASDKPNPVPQTGANLDEGIKLYAANCAVCHGAADAKPSNIAVGLYQKAPQLGKYGVEDDDAGVTYWKIYHGIRMTGMPAFRETLSEDQIWKITLFLQNMDQLPAGPQKIWNAVPSAAIAAAKPRK